MANNQLFVQGQNYKLSGSGITATDTSITLQSFQTPAGANILDADVGSTAWGTLEPGTDNEEIISFTTVTQNGDGTATLSGVTRGLKFVSPYDDDTSLRKAHAGGTIFILSNNPQVYENLISFNNDETVTGVFTFTTPDVPRLDTAHTYVAGQEEYFATKRYADSLAIAGAPDMSTTQKGVAEEATQAELDAGTATGGTGARLAVNPSTIYPVIQDSKYIYAADAEASDTYVITLTPAITAYVAGQSFLFSANTANTGASTLNVNGLGAITIKKNHDQDLENNDIESGSIVSVVYDGTNFQMLNQQASMPTTALLAESATFFNATDISGAEAETLTDGSDADSLHTHGEITSIGAVQFVANTAVFAGAAPTSFTDLDLSSVVGSKTALVFLKVESTSSDGGAHVAVRTNGETDVVDDITAYNGTAGAELNSLKMDTLLVKTDSSGVIEWIANVGNNIRIGVLAYFINS